MSGGGDGGTPGTPRMYHLVDAIIIKATPGSAGEKGVLINLNG